MRKNDPIKAQYLILLICCVLSIPLLIYQMVRIHSLVHGYLDIMYMVMLPVLVLLLIYGFFAVYRGHKRTEERRKRALMGDRSLLAEPQPAPNQYALPLPKTITMKANKRFYFIVMGYMLSIFLIAGVVFVPLIGGTQLMTKPIVWLFLGGFFVAIAAILFIVVWAEMFVLSRLLKQEIKIHEQGITTTYFGRTTTVLWNDAKCFAVWGGKTKRFTPYELIGKDGVVRWQVPNRFRAFYPFRPTTSYEEYCQNIGDLQHVVVAKTGLPLYDLRDKKLIWW